VDHGDGVHRHPVRVPFVGPQRSLRDGQCCRAHWLAPWAFLGSARWQVTCFAIMGLVGWLEAVKSRSWECRRRGEEVLNGGFSCVRESP
jgi:hypothetical protein